jgi:thiamine biosynthesis lipoprotein
MSRRKSILAGILLVSLAGCYRPVPSQSEFILNTICTVTLYDKGKPRVYREIFARLRDIEGKMSVYAGGSDIDRINKAAGDRPVAVGADVFEVVEKAARYAGLSDGAFDPSVGPLVSLWDIGGDSPRVPSPEDIDAVLPLVNWRDIELYRGDSSVFLRRPGMALDVGAVAKGYAADEAAAIIRKAGIPRAIIDLGGNILTVGKKKDGSPWRIGIQDPLGGRGEYIGIAEVGEQTVVTSGVYERFFIEGGERYHHILSTSDGRPVRNGLLSVSVIAGRQAGAGPSGAGGSADADALSTSAFALGYERGRALIESLEGAGGIFVFEDRTVRLTRGVSFDLSGGSYRIAAD